MMEKEHQIKVMDVLNVMKKNRIKKKNSNLNIKNTFIFANVNSQPFIKMNSQNI